MIYEKQFEFKDEKGSYNIIYKYESWSHGCHPETCGCGNRVESVKRKYKEYENGKLELIFD